MRCLPLSLRGRVQATLLAVLSLCLAAPALAERDWSAYGENLANHRYSPLSAVNATNVHGLERAWSVKTGSKGSFQASPIVVDGMMLITLPFNDVLALDAATGVELWRYEHELTSTESCCGPANRGAAVAHDRVYFVTIDARFIALDLMTGRVLWDRPITDVEAGTRERFEAVAQDGDFAGAKVVGGTGYSANMAPQVVGDTVLVGITGAGYGLHLDVDQAGQSTLSVVGLSGGGHGLRGFLVAYDAMSGEERWRFYAVQGPEWTGFWTRTTADGAFLPRDIDEEKAANAAHPEAWRYGGGSVWTTPAVDEALGLVYIGTGNPAPQMDDSTRGGDNRDTVSIVALDLATGERRWAYQQVPHDRWGYDVASPIVLFDTYDRGKPVPALAQAGKTGWVYVLDRRTGRFLYKSEPFVPQQNLFTPPTEQGVHIAPGIYGGASWSPMAYNPGLDRFFVMGIHHPTTYFQKPLTPTPEAPWKSYTYTRMDPEGRYGTLSAIDARSGAMAWQVRTDSPLVGGVLSTAGHLVFAGEGEGRLSAFDARSGRRLWAGQTAAGTNAPPISYEVGGVQYVAVAAGGNALFRFQTGDEIVAWRLPERMP